MENNQWYEQRDKRTDSCKNVTSDYKEAIINVRVSEDIREFRVQLLTHFSLLMLAKWCRNLVISANETDCLIPGQQGSLHSFLRREIQGADPLCNIRFDQQVTNASVTLFIGPAENDVPGDFISIDGIGWLASVGFNRSSKLPTVPGQDSTLGTCLAGCLGNAELFRYLVGLKSRPYVKWYSMWTSDVYDAMPKDAGPVVGDVNFGRVHLVGCGSIGSSFTYLLPYLNAKGDWLLVDPDSVEDHNTSSSLLFAYDDSRKSLNKAALCSVYLSRYGLRADPFEHDYKEYPYVHHAAGLAAADVILCFANENNIWATIQNLYPPVCFHATTSKSWGVHIGRHIPLVENCLMCTFQDVTETKYTFLCAEGAIPETEHQPETYAEQSHTAILPFLAPAAAVIALAEMLKALSGLAFPHDNTVIFNLGTSDGVFVTDYEAFGNCFICSSQETLYKRFGPVSRHWHLSTGKTSKE